MPRIVKDNTVLDEELVYWLGNEVDRKMLKTILEDVAGVFQGLIDEYKGGTTWQRECEGFDRGYHRGYAHGLMEAQARVLGRLRLPREDSSRS